MAILVNKTTRILMIPVPLSTKQDGRVSFDLRRLVPGTNEIEDSLLEVIKKSPTILQWQKSQMISLPKVTKSAAEGLEAFDGDVVSQLIEDCYDPNILEKWLDSEKRKDVKAALKKRKKDLEKLLSRESD